MLLTYSKMEQVFKGEIENIKDLNTLAGEGVASIKHTKDGARLKVR